MASGPPAFCQRPTAVQGSSPWWAIGSGTLPGVMDMKPQNRLLRYSSSIDFIEDRLV
jgi:hypothetical protein